MKSLALNEIASLKRSKQRDNCCYDTKQGEGVAKRVNGKSDKNNK
jgi:hypothetical protein